MRTINNPTAKATAGTTNKLDRESLEYRGSLVGLEQNYMDQLSDETLSRQVTLAEIKQDKTAY